MERTKRNGRKKGNQPPEPAVDEHHSLETPSCNLVVQVVKDVIPSAAINQEGAVSMHTMHTTGSKSSLLGSLVLHHLLEERKKQTTTKRSKPKKKRRKKKYNSNSNAASSIAAEEGASGDATTEHAATQASPQRPRSPIEPQIKDATMNEPPPWSDAPSPAQQRPCIADQTSPIVLQWLDRLLESSKQPPVGANRSLDAFLKALHSNKPRFLTRDISSALACPTCVPCRAAAESYWQSTGIPMQDLGLVPGDHHTDKIMLEAGMIDNPDSKSSLGVYISGVEDYDVERAMEEGLVLSDEEKKAKQIVALEPVVDMEGKIEAIQVTSELDARAVGRLIRQIVLPCGLTELEHANAVSVSDEQLKSIEDHVTEQQRRFHAQLKDLFAKKSSAQTLFHATDVNPSQTGSYDVKAATALQECDKECDTLLSAFVTTLLQITTLTDGLPDAEWAHVRTKRLWDFYEEGVQKILQKSLQHEGKLLQLASRPGVVPQMFMNAVHRSSFREVVSEKYHVLESFYVAFFSTIQDETENPRGPTFLRRLMTHQAFTNGTILEANMWLDRTKLDNVIARLVETFAALIQSVRSGQLTEIHNAQEQKSNRLFEILQESTTMIVDEYARLRSGFENVDQSKWKALRKEGTELISQYSSYLPRTEPIESNEFQADFNADSTLELAEMRKDLDRLVVNMISQWRCLRWMRSQTIEAPVMPLRLLKFMNKGEFEIPVTYDACHGGGGKRRFASVLASLLFQWLIGRCNEWHAELTQAELLESMGEFDSPTKENAQDASKPSKASKKRKKKKAQRGANTTVAEKEPFPTTDETKSVDSGGTEENVVPPIQANEPETLVPASSRETAEQNAEAKKTEPSLPEAHKQNTTKAVDTTPLPKAMNGVYKPSVEAKDEYIPGVAEEKEEYEPPLAEEREPERIVNSKRGPSKKGVQTASQASFAAKDAIQTNMEKLKEPAKKSEPKATTPTDAINSKNQKPKDPRRQRKPSPPKKAIDSKSEKPKDSTNQRKPSPPKETTDSKSQNHKDSTKQRKPSPPKEAIESKTQHPKDSTRQKNSSPPKEAIDSKNQRPENSRRQRKPSPPKETIDPKNQNPKDSKKQRKPSPQKDSIDSRTQEPKEAAKERNPSPPMVSNSGRAKDSGKRGNQPKNVGKDKVDSHQQQQPKEAARRKNQESNSVKNTSESTQQQKPKEATRRQNQTKEATNGAAESKKEQAATRRNESRGSPKENGTNQKHNKSNKAPQGAQKSNATPANEADHEADHEADQEANQETNQETDQAVSIGVEECSGRVDPVEDFLVSRLVEILTAGSKDAKGNPIVFL